VTDTKSEAEAILRRAEETLATARHGLDDLTGPSRTRRMTGLRNLIVFGRSVTWVLQNLKTPLGARFEQWYEARQAEMKSDALRKVCTNPPPPCLARA
jgi:hypothetical protein